MRIHVLGSGLRGAHGCTETLVVEGIVTPASDGVHDYIVRGTVVQHDICYFCGGENLVGREIEWGVWYDPEYYGHDDYQL